MKIYLIAPKNPESFWTFDRILPVLHKKCVFPNLSLPTVAAITPQEHEVVLCDENVEPVDFDTDADVIGLTGYVVHKARILHKGIWGNLSDHAGFSAEVELAGKGVRI